MRKATLLKRLSIKRQSNQITRTDHATTTCRASVQMALRGVDRTQRCLVLATEIRVDGGQL